MAKVFEFLIRLRDIDDLSPVIGECYRPAGEPVGWRCAHTFSEAAPRPIFRLRNEISAQRVSLNVPPCPNKVRPALDRNRFKSRLIHSSLTHTVMIVRPSTCVCCREPLHEPRKVSVCEGP